MALWLLSDPLVLASRSPVRRAMLEAAGIPVAVQPADIDERGLEASARRSARDTVLLLAREKALAVASQHRQRLVVGADQTLVLGTERFIKPADRTAARRQLLALQGRTHELHSAVAVARDDRLLYEHADSARLTMRRFSESFLDRYLDAAGAGAIDSVGAYQLEQTGIHLFEKIEGDHFTILGLPLLPLIAFLRTEGCLA